MPSNCCKQCNQPLVEIDHWGGQLTGCPNCNRRQALTEEWCRLAADIVALRALQGHKTKLAILKRTKQDKIAIRKTTLRG